MADYGFAALTGPEEQATTHPGELYGGLGALGLLLAAGLPLGAAATAAPAGFRRLSPTMQQYRQGNFSRPWSGVYRGPLEAGRTTLPSYQWNKPPVELPGSAESLPSLMESLGGKMSSLTSRLSPSATTQTLQSGTRVSTSAPEAGREIFELQKLARDTGKLSHEDMVGAWRDIAGRVRQRLPDASPADFENAWKAFLRHITSSPGEVGP